ncbi:MAG: hypothetical protein V7L00_20565 [Nostoc sp.]|uniref:hypothetical protein n=1 Tax=unclassified Nostoc TaxID=2593658 RepID=UPI0025FD22C3|nr:hypothetical protein [Nostoc sp. JL33]MBN3871117.1 hypothetical protein [Nostoc sp. JL33]
MSALALKSTTKVLTTNLFTDHNRWDESDNCSTSQPTKLSDPVLYSEIVTNLTGVGLDSSWVHPINSHSSVLTAFVSDAYALTRKQRSHTNIEEEYICQNSGAKPETFPLLRSESTRSMTRSLWRYQSLIQTRDYES